MLLPFASTTPVPTPSMTVDPELVTPGPIGFGIIVIVVIAVAALIWDMNRRIRRVRYREEVRAELDAEEAAIAATTETGASESSAEDTAIGDASGAERNTLRDPRDSA